jgi:hypothetical protein
MCAQLTGIRRLARFDRRRANKPEIDVNRRDGDDVVRLRPEIRLRLKL